MSPLAFPALSIFAVPLLILLTGGTLLYFYYRRRAPVFLRGRPRLKQLAVRREGNDKDETVLWGAEALPAESATTHFLTVGTTGSGKTLLLQRLMASVLPTIGRRNFGKRSGHSLTKPLFERRALVYDAKGDVLPTLQQMASCRIVRLHPFDQRGAAWDMARDITTPAAALQAAALLMPPERAGSGNPFFPLAAQNLLRGVLLTFLQTVGENWTLRDVVLALRFEERLRQILGQTVEGRAILDQFFGSGDTLQGVRATLANKIAPFEVIAAAWDTAKEKVSLREFMDGEFILVLGNDEATRTALDALNRVLFQRLSELILSGAESRTNQTWLFLDEVREAGRLEGLARLMTKGRSKGACVVLGFQAIEGMREVHGANLAEEIAGLCNNKAILRLESAVSAQWCSALFGKTEEIERRRSRSHSLSERGVLPTFGRSRTLAEQRVTTEAVLASEIMTLPPTGPQHGLNGFFITRTSGAYRATIPWNQLKLLQPQRPSGAAPSCISGNNTADFEPRPESSQYLREWTPEDLKRLGLKALRLAVEVTGSEAKAEGGLEPNQFHDSGAGHSSGQQQSRRRLRSVRGAVAPI